MIVACVVISLYQMLVTLSTLSISAARCCGDGLAPVASRREIEGNKNTIVPPVAQLRGKLSLQGGGESICLWYHYNVVYHLVGLQALRSAINK
jgi:hypothetical protein